MDVELKSRSVCQLPTLQDKLQLVEERPFVFPRPVGQLEDMERIMHNCLMDKLDCKSHTSM